MFARVGAILLNKLGSPMLEQEFLAEIRALRLAWHLRGPNVRTYQRIDGWLREVCPLCAVANRIHGGTLTLQAMPAAWTIGIPSDVAGEIMGAADTLKGYDERLRIRLLRACALSA